ncbi:MAG: hypothetical protein JWQ42_4597 [Edaphobacter sp.]|nr:hypothetical protein [Edaphobacter sp.]
MLGIPEGTLRYWRNVGLGPVWHKLEGSIRYDLVDVEAYSFCPGIYGGTPWLCVSAVASGITTSQ